MNANIIEMFRYCMPTKLAVGASCGWTAASVRAHSVPTLSQYNTFLLRITPECVTVQWLLTSSNVLMACVLSPVPQPLLSPPRQRQLHLAPERGPSAMTPTQQTMLQELHVAMGYLQIQMFREGIDLKFCISYPGCLPSDFKSIR